MSPTRIVVTPVAAGYDLHLSLPSDRLLAAYTPEVTPTPDLAVDRSWLMTLIAEHVHAADASGHPWQISSGPITTQRSDDPAVATSIEVDVYLRAPENASSHDVIVQYDLIIHPLITHQVLVFQADESGERQALTSLNRHQMTFALHPHDAHSELRRFFMEGMRHIADGTDHLMFLLMLLLVVPQRNLAGRWRATRNVPAAIGALLKTVTAFTLGHSLTLLAGSLGWMEPSQRWVEAVIALSVLLTAIHAIRPFFPAREWVVAAGFGLIHGMAFASELSHDGLQHWALVKAVLAFNLGIEAMQLVAVAVTLPVLLWLAADHRYRWVRTSLGSLGALAATIWLTERVSGAIPGASLLLARGSAHLHELPLGLLILATLFQLARLGTRRTTTAE